MVLVLNIYNRTKFDYLSRECIFLSHKYVSKVISWQPYSPRLLLDYLDIPSHNKNTPTSTPSLTTLHNNHLSILTILQHTTQTFPTYKKIYQNHQILQPTSKIISSLSYNHTISPSHYSDSIFYLIQKNLSCNNLSLNHKYFNLKLYYN